MYIINLFVYNNVRFEKNIITNIEVRGYILFSNNNFQKENESVLTHPPT